MQTDACFIHINKTPVTVTGETGPGGEVSWVVGSYSGVVAPGPEPSALLGLAVPRAQRSSAGPGTRQAGPARQGSSLLPPPVRARADSRSSHPCTRRRVLGTVPSLQPPPQPYWADSAAGHFLPFRVNWPLQSCSLHGSKQRQATYQVHQPGRQHVRNVGRGAPGCGELGARAVTGRARGGSLGGCPTSAWGSGCWLPESVPLVTVQLAVHWIPIKIYTKNETKNAWFSPSLQQQETPKSLQPVVIPPLQLCGLGENPYPLWPRFPSAELRAQAVQ